MPEQRIGLALSGGGSRAISFHLGCLRALHDRGVLNRVSVLSAVSGGSVIGALWAYRNASFDEFDGGVVELLRGGLMAGIARHALASRETPRIVASTVVAGGAAAAGGLVRAAVSGLGLAGVRHARLTAAAVAATAPVRRFSSLTTAFENMLRATLFADTRMNEVAREGLTVVLNATELRMGTAFRFGSERSGTWRLGTLVETPKVATAVAASAAFPVLLPALDLDLEFDLRGERKRHRVIVADGGVYDNLGTSCLLPEGSPDFSTNAHPVDFVIACDAGQGMPSGASLPFTWATRMIATVNAMHRRNQTQTFGLLHRMAAAREIEGFLMPYLGQVDERLPVAPPDLVPRSFVIDYPTNFSPMSTDNIEKLTMRGEQLTRALLEHYGLIG